ncbi:MAG: hypothetical protein KGZ30_04650 [Anaplasmataceae bacterium]|nr:hypothetical protein [Anaplasmataceae bacterium]
MKSLKFVHNLGQFFNANGSYSQHVVDLRPHWYRRSPLLAGFLLLAIIASFYGTRLLFTRADAIDFNATSCLGAWQNPTLAQGEPQSASLGEAIDQSNSALWSGGEGSIFCGGFVPDDFTPRGDITEVGLTLIWKVGNEEAPKAIEVSSTIETTVIENSSSTETSTENEVTENAIPQVQKENEPPTIEKEPVSFWHWLTPLALAQEEPVSEEPPPPVAEASSPAPLEKPEEVIKAEEPPASTENTGESKEIIPTSDTEEKTPKPEEGTNSTGQKATISDNIIQLPPIIATIGNESSTESSTVSSTDIAISTSTPEIPKEIPDENFLRVSYSLDGTNWETLGKVNEYNWHHFTASLSIKDWDELKKLQVKVESIESSTSSPPPVFLDGIFIEAKYTILSFFDLGGEVRYDDVIILPSSLKEDSEDSSSLELKTKIARLLNPRYAEVIGPEAYDERRTVWFSWCGKIYLNNEYRDVCDYSGQPSLLTEEDGKIVLLSSKSGGSTIEYISNGEEIDINLNILNDGWWNESSSVPIQLVINFPDKLSLSNNGQTLHLDEGKLEINLPYDAYNLIVETSSYDGFKKATYSFLLNSFPLNSSETIKLKIWKRL